MPKRPCEAKDCQRLSGQHSGFCIDHVRTAYQCCFDQCLARVAAWNRERLCKEHRWLANK